MDLLRSVFFLSVLTSLSQGQRSDDKLGVTLTNNQLVETLQDFLNDVDSRVSLSVEKKASIIPRCDVGERCAMKHGPRIGRLCECLHGAACNTFFLRCY